MTGDFTLSDDVAVPFVYAKWSLVDWIEGTEGFQLELEGAYVRFMNRLYRRGRALPDDDRFMSGHMALSLRVWKRIKAVLVELGKIIVVNGCLTNPRFEKERLERASMLRKQSEAAVANHESRRLGNASLSKFEQSLAKTSAKLQANSDEKPNEINVSRLSDHTHYKSKEKERKNPPCPPVGGGVEGKAASQVAKVAVAVAAVGMLAAAPLAAEPAPPPPIQMNLLDVGDAGEPPAPAPTPRKRGNRIRLAADWDLPADWRQETREKFGATDYQIDRQIDRFRRYWTGADCRNPLKADWKQTWLNWIESQQMRNQLGAPTPPGQPTQAADGSLPKYRYVNGVRRTIVRVNGREMLV